MGKRRQRRAARVLAKCRKSHRCGTEVCRVCMRDFRVGWTGEAVKIVMQRPHWTRCCIITEGLLVRYGVSWPSSTLHAEIEAASQTHRPFRASRPRRSRRARYFTQHREQRYRRLAIPPVPDRRRGERRASSSRRSRRHSHPNRPRSCRTTLRRSQHPLRGHYVRLQGGDQAALGPRLAKTATDRTKDQPLKAADIRKLAPFLAKYKVGARLILSGVRRNGQRLVFTPTKSSRHALKVAGGAATVG